MARRTRPEKLWAHAVREQDPDLLAMLLTAAALELLTTPAVAHQPQHVKQAILTTAFLNQPARVRA